MDYIKDLNDRIRAAKKAIIEAEFAGILGAEMIALKAELRRLKAIHAAYMGK